MTRKPIIFEQDRQMQRRQRRLQRALRLGVLVLVAVAIALTSLYFYSRLAVEEQAARDRLRTFAELRAESLQRFLRAHAQETALWAGQEEMRERMRQLTQGWNALNAAERNALRQMLAPAPRTRPKASPLLDRKRNKAARNGSGGSKDSAPRAAGGVTAGNAASSMLNERTDAMNAFLALQRRIQAELENFLQHHGFANIHLITPEGFLVHSVHRRPDFGANLAVNGSIYAGRALGQTFQRALRLVSPGMVVFEDFHHYPEPDDPPRAFFASPLLEVEGTKVGVLVVEIDTAPIDRILDPGDALGRYAAIYAVGPDMLLRNDLPGHGSPTALRLRIDTPAVHRALDGEQVITTWRQQGKKRIGVAMPMEFQGVRWAVVTEMPLAEMRKPYQPYAVLWGLSVALILLLGAVQYWLMRRG